MSLDSGMLVVITIIAMYMTLVFGLLFYVKNEWCDILHHNLTVKGIKNIKTNAEIVWLLGQPEHFW